jgi:hypothetical protein
VTGPEHDLRTDIPHSARVYDYWLGGKDNFEIDRMGAEAALRDCPEFLDYAVGNRKFLVRATRYLADEAGIRQFLDIGTGFPTSPNVHEVAAKAAGDSQVVYVDNDPMVYSHAQGLLAKSPVASAVFADLRDPDTVLRAAGERLDLDKPVGLMFVACLHHVRDHEDPAGIVARYLERMAPGSYLALSHCTSDMNPDGMRTAAAGSERAGCPFVPRGRDEIRKLFNGRPLIDPGLVLVSYWRPDNGDAGYNAGRASAYGAIATL